MNALERLADALKVGKKERGHRKPVYRPDGTLKGHAQGHIEVMASDVHEVCGMVKKHNELSQAWFTGTKGLKKGSTVTVYSDHLFDLIELVVSQSRPEEKPG